MKKFGSILLIVSMIVSLMPVNLVQAETSYNYGEALQKAIIFYEFQRSGDLPEDIRTNWRGDSGLEDGEDVGLDLTGGWYDAGDHVKFNLPMAYTAAMLAWTVYEEEEALRDSGQLNYLMEEIKWATDYLIKCHPEPNVFYYQVGNGTVDHSWWGPAEVMQMERPAYKVDMSNPGSAVVGGAAAALAAAAVVFKSTDPAYAATLTTHAEELFAFADATKSDSGYTEADGFYTSFSGYYDELTWASTWLYLATGEESYLDKAESYVGNWATEPQTPTIAYKWAHSWDDVHIGTALLLARITDDPLYKETLERHFDYWTIGYDGERIAYTPQGLAWLDSWGALRYATTTAFLATIYAEWEGCSEDRIEIYKDFAKQQVDYALGSTGRSFVVGYGVNPPQQPHHRTAHSSWADSQTVPNYHRHTIYGALVGGPGRDDSYSDDIGNYINNEIACDYNAGFVGALAQLYGEYGGDPIPNFNAVEEVTNDEFFVEAGVNASGPNFVEIKAVMNNRSGWPARMGDKLSFKYFIDISEAVELGYSVDDFTTDTNYNTGAVVSELLPWDESANLYYVDVDYTGTKIYPGGQSAYRKEVQLRISGPVNTTFWDSSNDFSYTDIDGISAPGTVKTEYIPVYDDGVKVFGMEPGSPQDSSSIYPTSAVFDKYSPEDIEIEMSLNGNTLDAIRVGSDELIAGVDYLVEGETVSLLADYLENQVVGTLTLVFDFSSGIDRKLTVAISDSTPSGSISKTEATFDKVVELQEDITVEVALNGHSLEGLLVDDEALEEGIDYTILGDTVTLLKAYLAEQPLGKVVVTFDFDAGNDAVLTVTVKDSSIVVAGDIKVQMFNGNNSPSANGITPKIQLVNDGDTDVELSDITLRYYYTIDGEKDQNFWCDWSTVGVDYVTSDFVKMDTATADADHYLEIGFEAAAGILEVGEVIEVQVRFSKVDWSNYDQSNDYSFNGESSRYVDWDKVTGYVNGVLQWGMEP